MIVIMMIIITNSNDNNNNMFTVHMIHILYKYTSKTMIMIIIINK